MRATTIMLLAIGLLILTHWANNEPTINAKMIIELVFALLVIALLDQGRTEPIAQGFAWLFLAAVALSSKSLLNALNKISPPPAMSTAQPKLIPQQGPYVAATPVPQAPPGYGYGY